jgi:ADP-ribosylglycohydrolase
MHGLLDWIHRGVHWSEAARRLFGGAGSLGNGSAMRVAPVGGYFAEDIDAVIEHAARSAQVTHAHPEATAGAIAAAVAGATAWNLREVRPVPRGREFLDLIRPRVPDSEVREKLRHARDLVEGASIQLAVSALGNGSRISAPDTVPFALWCAAQHLDNYEEALWLTVSGLGDRDTTCAIVGGIVALCTGVDGIPAAWRTAREPLPGWPFASGEGEDT